MTFLFPWIVTFGFGLVMFLVGMHLQRIEKRLRDERRSRERHMQTPNRWSAAQALNQPSQFEQMGTYSGFGEQRDPFNTRGVN